MEKGNLEMILEDISGKFDLVLEGYAALDRKLDNRFDLLNEKIETNSFKIDVLNQKIDGVRTELKADIKTVEVKVDDVAADLQAHRADTEVHRGYRVRED
ncbi:MAG: hypothetical protein RQ722_13035 [Desulfuromonadales bacterium]|nr:hypothetical protein [Desulfuromonadales bacterium]